MGRAHGLGKLGRAAREVSARIMAERLEGVKALAGRTGLLARAGL
jgi:hypothetical protein